MLIRHKAVIDFKKRVLELDNEVKPVRVSYEQVLDTVRISGIKVIQKWVGSGDTEWEWIYVEREREMKVKSEYGRTGHSLSLIHI